MDAEKIFSREALDKLRSPEKLNTLIGKIKYFNPRHQSDCLDCADCPLSFDVFDCVLVDFRRIHRTSKRHGFNYGLGRRD